MTYSHSDAPTGFTPGSDLLSDLDWVQRLAFRLCSDRALAEDLRQEAALAVLGQGVPGDGGRRPWLAGIVRNKLRMNRRTETRRRDREASFARSEAGSTGVDVVERAETQRAVTDAVLRLREPYRTTVLHRYFDEWSPTEIAERTGTPVDTVKSRLKRGMRALEDDLAGVFGEAGAGSGDGSGAGWFSALFPLAVMESKRRALVSAAGGAQGLTSVPLTTAGLFLMIAKFSLVSVALLALFGLLLLTRSPQDGSPSTAAVEPAALQATGDGVVHAPAATELDGLRRSGLSAPVGQADPKADAAPSVCELSGRVIDDRGRSLGGLGVALYRGGDELLATANTDPDGRFSLTTPQQTDPLLELRIEGEWFHVSERLEFGGTRWNRRLPLLAGPRDIGTVVLAAAGAVSGRVVDSSGAPVAGAIVTTLGDETTTSASDGSFRLDRLSLGPDSLEVRADGLPIAEADLALEASSVMAGIEVRLEPRALLHGQVVDHLGKPVTGARVELDPVDEDDIAHTTSGPDGTFEVPFLRLGSAYLRVDAGGFDLWDSEEWDQEVSPAAAPIRVELSPAARVEFSVVDGSSGEPIERYGIDVIKGAGSEGMQVGRDAEPPLQDRPGGRAVRGARDEFDQVVVFAEGYELYRDDVLTGGTTADGVRTQTVRLERLETPLAGSIKGRVVRDGVPLANAFIEVEGGIPMGERMKRLAGKSGDVFVAAGSDDPLVRTGPDGTFSLDGLEMPLYRLRVHALGCATRELPVVELARGDTLELGDIVCSAGGTVRGQLILPPGVSPLGLVASVGRGLGSVSAPLDDGGGFELLSVPVGSHTVDIEARHGDFEDGAEADVLVTADQVTSVLIDASGMGTARVRLVLDLDGEPAADCRVLFVEAEHPETVVGVAFCDERGRIDTSLPAAHDVAVCLMENLGDYLRHPSVRLRLEAGADLEETLRFRLGAAQVTVGAGRALPSDGGLGVELFNDDGVLHQRITLEIEDGAVLDTPDAAYSPARGTEGGFVLDLRRALEGEWTVKVSVVALDPGSVLDRDLDPATIEPEVWLEERSITVPGTGR